MSPIKLSDKVRLFMDTDPELSGKYRSSVQEELDSLDGEPILEEQVKKEPIKNDSFLGGLGEKVKSFTRGVLKIPTDLLGTVAEIGGREIEESTKPLRLNEFKDSLVKSFTPTKEGLLDPRNGLNFINEAGGLLSQIGLKANVAKDVRKQFSDLGIKEGAQKFKRGASQFIEEIPFLKSSEQEKQRLEEPINFGNLFKGDSEELNKTASKFAANLPSFATSIALTLATKKPMLPSIALGIMEGGDVGQKAEAAGKDPRTAQGLQLMTIAGNSLLENWGIGKITNPLIKGTGKASIREIAESIVKKGTKESFLKRFGAKAVRAGDVVSHGLKQAAENIFTEGGQEAMQSLFSNAVEKYGFNTTKNLMDGVLESGYIGALMGGGAGAFTGTEAARRKPLTIQDVAAKAKEMGMNRKEFQQLSDTVGVLLAGKAEGADKAEVEKILSDAVQIPTGKNNMDKQAEDVDSFVEEQTVGQEKRSIDDFKFDIAEAKDIPVDYGVVDIATKGKLKKLDEDIADIDQILSARERVSEGNKALLLDNQDKLDAQKNKLSNDKEILAKKLEEIKLSKAEADVTESGRISKEIASINKQLKDVEAQAKNTTVFGIKLGGREIQIEELKNDRSQRRERLREMESHGKKNSKDYVALKEQIKSLDKQIKGLDAQEKQAGAFGKQMDKGDKGLDKLRKERDLLDEQRSELLITAQVFDKDNTEFDVLLSEKELDRAIKIQVRKTLQEAKDAGITLSKDLKAIALTKIQLLTGLKRVPTERMSFVAQEEIKQLQRMANPTSSLETLQALYIEAQAIKNREQTETMWIKEARQTEEQLERDVVVSLLQKNFSSKPITYKNSITENLAKYHNTNLISIARLADLMDGAGGRFNGPIHDILNNQFKQAENQTVKQIEKYTIEAETIAKEVGFTKKRQQQEVLINGETFTISDCAHVWAVRQNKENIAAFVFGNGLDVGMLKQMMEQLTPKEKAGIDAITNRLVERFPQLRDTYIKVHDGTKDLKQVKRGYFPMRRVGVIDSTFSDELGNEFIQRDDYRRSMVSKKFLASRVKIAPEHQIPIHLGFFEQLVPHIKKREHFIAMAETSRHAANIFESAEVRKVIASIPELGSEASNQIKAHLDVWANNGMKLATDMESQLISALKARTSVAYLGFNVTTMSIQATAIFLGLGNDLHPVDLASGFGQSVWGMVKDASTLGKTKTSLSKFVHEKSQFMKNRVFERDILFLKQNEPSKYKQLINKFGEMSMWGIMQMDRLISEGLWKAKYDKIMKSGESETVAIQESDNFIARTQSTGKYVDRAAILDGRLSFMTSFLSQSSQMYGVAMHDIPQAFQHGRKAQSVLGALGLALMVYTTWVIRNGKAFPDDDKEVKSLLSEPTSWLPVAGSVFSQNMQGYSSTVPSLGFAESAAKAIFSRTAAKQSKYLANLVGQVAGIPVKGIIKDVTLVSKFLEEQQKSPATRESEKRQEDLKKKVAKINKERKRKSEYEKSKRSGHILGGIDSVFVKYFGKDSSF